MDKKVIVIVGGTGEIGSAIVDSLVLDYRIICISGNSTSSKVNGVKYIIGDMTNIPVMKSVVDQIYLEYKKVDLLINCIGKNTLGEIDDIDEKAWTEVIDTNLKSIFFLCKFFGKKMLENKNGLIINFSSTAGIKPILKSPHYIAAKSGVIALTKYFAGIYAPYLRVNCIAPGYVLTENHKPEKYSGYNEAINRIPLQKMVGKEDITETVKYLIKSECTTGQTIAIDGGLSL